MDPGNTLSGRRQTTRVPLWVGSALNSQGDGGEGTRVLGWAGGQMPRDHRWVRGGQKIPKLDGGGSDTAMN